jgi:arsenite methyltransferase
MSFISLELDTPELARHYEQVSNTIQFIAGERLAAMLGVAAGEKILDVGCGAGQLAGHLADLTGDSGLVIGVDPLPRRVELAQRRARPNLRFQVDNAYDLSAFAPGSFDAVYLNVVFHWFPEKTEPLRRFHALLKAGGRLALSAPMAGHIYRIQAIKAEVLAQEAYAGYPEGLNGRAHPVDADELVKLLMATGYAAP